VIFGGLPTLANQIATVAEDGSFYLTIELQPGEGRDRQPPRSPTGGIRPRTWRNRWCTRKAAPLAAAA